MTAGEGLAAQRLRAGCSLLSHCLSSHGFLHARPGSCLLLGQRGHVSQHRAAPSITHPSQACLLQWHRTLPSLLAIVPFAHQLVQFQRSKDGENDNPGFFSGHLTLHFFPSPFLTWCSGISALPAALGDLSARFLLGFASQRHIL